MTSRHRLRRAVLPFALIGALSATTPAFAQSNATGTIYGLTGDPDTSVVVENVQTGLVRTLRPDAAGRYRATSLPVGRYRVSLQRDGATIASRDDVSVLLGGGSEISFSSGGADTQTLDRVTVTATSVPPIDVSQVDSRQVFTAEQIEKLAVGRDVAALALLTPGAVSGDSRYQGARGFTDVASFGGSSASENAYYINGYAVTNPYTAVGATTLPFGGISQYQAITGGYSAEFGRATGGVVNIITQRGTNDWKFGGQVVWNPDAGRAKREIIYYPEGTSSPNAGRIYQDREKHYENESVTYAAYAGGPIVKDRLFFYAAGEITRQDVQGLSVGTSGWSTGTNGLQNYDYKIPRWLAKLDWQINDYNLLELTAISDVTKDKERYTRYNFTTGERDPNTVSGYDYEDGGELYIGKYTGYLTDSLTLTALYGRQKQDHLVTPFGLNPDPNAVYVTDGRNIADEQKFRNSQQAFSSVAWNDQYDETDGYRVDLEWRLGDHDIRFGLDSQDLEVRRGSASTGPGYYWSYSGGVGAVPGTPIAGGAVIPASGQYVTRVSSRTGGTFRVEQSAQYIEDRWQASDNVLLSLGLRNEQFTNYDSTGAAYIKQRHQLAPRLGASWDVFGDASLKVFANAGRYHLALPNRTAYRQAAPSLGTSEYFAFTGIDPATGVPLGLTPLGNGPFSPNNEYGQAKEPSSIAAKNIKAHYQDEYVLGFEKQLSDRFSGGARFIYRDLKSAIEDFCDFRPGVAWAEANGVDPFVPGGIQDSFYSCRLFNPGESNTFVITDDNGTVTTVPLTAAQLGFPKLKRRYLGVDLFLEHKFDGQFYGKVDYTWSHNYGNAEGQLNSDLGQADVSATQTFDFPELTLGSSGNLPNDRRHYLKAFGYYQLTPQWQVSATFSAASGRPKNRTGLLPDSVSADDPYFYDYIYYNGPYYFFVNGEPSPRGSHGNLPWTTKIDLGLTWRPAFADGKLQVRGDVFNVLDRQTVQNQLDYYENPSIGSIYAQANRVVSYQAPRSYRFQVRYDF